MKTYKLFKYHLFLRIAENQQHFAILNYKLFSNLRKLLNKEISMVAHAVVYNYIGI